MARGVDPEGHDMKRDEVCSLLPRGKMLKQRRRLSSLLHAHWFATVLCPCMHTRELEPARMAIMCHELPGAPRTLLYQVPQPAATRSRCKVQRAPLMHLPHMHGHAGEGKGVPAQGAAG